MPIPKIYKELCFDFLVAYSDLATIRTNEELDKKKRSLSRNVIKIIPYKEISLLTKRELQIYKGKNLTEECIFCTQWDKCSKPIALLRHLRNAIAHGCIRQNGNYFEMEDWDDDNKNNITALAKFDKIRIKRILELFQT